MAILLIICVIIGADVIWHIRQYREIKRLDENWNDLFNSKLTSEQNCFDLCRHYLEKIDDLYAELEKYKGAQNEGDSTGNN